jgi:glycine/D-amino acid oxidase-like deaminating enzyme
MAKRESTTTFDVVIIGGGVIGSSIAYHFSNDGFDGRIAVFEKDPTYEFSSTTLSAGGVREQFSTEVNIRISQHSIKFYERFDEVMAVNGEKAHANFRQQCPPGGPS